MPMQIEQLPSPAMSPAQFGLEYTEYYQRENSDSPESARKQLIARLIESIRTKLQSQSTVIVLDLGAGKQQLERELQLTPAFAHIADQVKIVTLDIAKFTGRQSLRTAEISHVEANGAELPFAEGAFDIIFSCMAIDFMPRSETFTEVKRTLKSDGDLLINFHHPNLQNKVTLSRQSALDEQRTVKQKLRFMPANSEKRPRYLERLHRVEIQLRDIEFVENIFPKLIFLSAEEIASFLSQFFPTAQVQVSEQAKHLSENGWYAAYAKN